MRLDVDGATPGTAVRIVLEREATLRWAPSRPPTEFEIYDVRFERAGAPTLSGDPVAPAFELARDMDMQRGVLDASRRSAWTGAALGVPYRAVLYDLLGEVPGCAVDVAPLTGGEDRRVVVPLPDRLGVVRLRVSKIDGRPAAGAKLRYRLAPTDGSAPVFEDGSFAPAFFVEKEAEAILRDVRIAPLTVWIVDAEKGWGTLRTTARPSGEDAAVELRLRPTRSLVFRFRTRFRVFGGVCLRAVSAEGTTVPCATSTGADPQDRRWAGGALLCPADALRLVWRVSGRNLSVDLPACEAFARDEREAPLPGVGELVVKSAGERPVPAFDVEPVRVAGLDGWTAEDGAWALAAGSGPFRHRHRFERRLALWPGVWLVRTKKGESKEVEGSRSQGGRVRDRRVAVDEGAALTPSRDRRRCKNLGDLCGPASTISRGASAWTFRPHGMQSPSRRWSQGCSRSERRRRSRGRGRSGRSTSSRMTAPSNATSLV